MSVCGELQQQIYITLIAEAGIKRNECRMIEEGLQLNLAHLLVYGTISFLLGLTCQSLFADNLESSQKASLAMSGYLFIYLTRCTSPKRPLPSFFISWNSCSREG
jgi:hypothetical protein